MSAIFFGLTAAYGWHLCAGKTQRERVVGGLLLTVGLTWIATKAAFWYFTGLTP